MCSMADDPSMHERRMRTFEVLTEEPDTQINGCIVTYGHKIVRVVVHAETYGEARLKVLKASNGLAPIYDMVER